ncbi:MAG: hypothetical protein GXO32_01410, partial [Crenarchaeota archaeon]|nr:hypothetical protein [Thermoproteota archaeon]
MAPQWLALAALSAAVTVLYVRLGLCYASSLMLAASLCGYSLRYSIPSILATQVAISILAGALRMREAGNQRAEVAKLGALAGSSALAAVVAATLLGVRLCDWARLAASAAALAAASITNALSRSEPRAATPKLCVAMGIAAGFFKGVVGGGANGVLILAQRVARVSIDRATHLALLTQVAMTLAALAPYAALSPSPQLSIAALPPLLAGSIAGCLASLAIPRVTSLRTRTVAASLTTLA